MTLIGLLIFLAVAGLVLYLLPLEPGIKNIIVKIVIVVACVWVVVWLLQSFGVLHGGNLKLK